MFWNVLVRLLFEFGCRIEVVFLMMLKMMLKMMLEMMLMMMRMMIMTRGKVLYIPSWRLFYLDIIMRVIIHCAVKDSWSQVLLH